MTVVILTSLLHTARLPSVLTITKGNKIINHRITYVYRE